METPSIESRGLTFWPIPEFSDVEIAFGADSDKFFSRHDMPDVPREFEKKANDLFFSGGTLDGLDPRVDKALASRAIQAWLCSFAPAHEAKSATVGYALWVWSTPKALDAKE